MLPLAVDAVADAMFYATNLCSTNRLDAGELFRASRYEATVSALPSVCLLGMFAAAGRLSHVSLKSAQKIRGYDDRDKARREIADHVARLFYFARCFAAALEIDLMVGFRKTVEEVLKRDWKSNPKGGSK
jgi:hypothetical protein